MSRTFRIAALLALALGAVAPAHAHSPSWSGSFNAGVGIAAPNLGSLFWEVDTPGNGAISSVVAIDGTAGNGAHRIRVSRTAASPAGAELAIKFRVGGAGVPASPHLTSGGKWEGTIPKGADRMVVYGPFGSAMTAVAWTATIIGHA